MNPRDRVTLQIEKPAAGGRMIARHEGAVVLVSGAIPGEIVEAEIEKVQRGTAWARTVSVRERSPDRVETTVDWMCGGNVFAHVSYPRQLTLKRQILDDAFARIGRLQVPSDLAVTASPPAGYRMRARLHVADGRLGFFREGTHQLCDAAITGQLLPPSLTALRALTRALGSEVLARVAEVELSENCPASERAVHLTLHEGAELPRLDAQPEVGGIRGISCSTRSSGRPLVLFGEPDVSDDLTIDDAGQRRVRVTRQAHAFFQGNRFLLSSLVRAVVDAVPDGRVIDLYAGVGVFSVPLAARGNNDVIAVEGDRVSAHDLKRNAVAVAGGIEARHQSVERFLQSHGAERVHTIIVDPPRTGMSKEALAGAIRLRPARLVYVSCDVATLARDARIIIDRGYRLSRMQAFDLFPNTGHVESLCVFDN
jgi:23S rRNA (uracil1939-C5)-methyltransferase